MVFRAKMQKTKLDNGKKYLQGFCKVIPQPGYTSPEVKSQVGCQLKASQVSDISESSCCHRIKEKINHAMTRRREKNLEPLIDF